MTDQAGEIDQEYFERHLRALLEALMEAHPEIVATCKPGMNARRVEGDQIEIYMVSLDGTTPVVIGTFPARWVRHPESR